MADSPATLARFPYEQLTTITTTTTTTTARADFNAVPRGSLVHGGADGAYELLTTGVLAASHPDHPATAKPAVRLAPAREPASPNMGPLTSPFSFASACANKATKEEMPCKGSLFAFGWSVPNQL
jgi:hypothetical protein